MAFNLAYNKSKMCKTLDYWSREKFNIDFLEEGPGIVSPPHFVYDFSRKMFLILYSINWSNLTVWLPLLLDILGICIFQLFLFQVVTSCFKIKLIFLIKPLLYMNKKLRQKINILRVKRWNNKHFSLFLQRFHLPEIVSDLRVRL